MAETVVIGRSKAIGAIYFATPAATSNVTATPIKAAGTTAAQGTAFLVTQATTNRLTYTGSRTRTFYVAFIGSVTAAAATNAVFHLYLSGAPITGASTGRSFPIADRGNAVIHCIVDVATNGYIELWCETDDGDDLTIQTGVLSMMSVD